MDRLGFFYEELSAPEFATAELANDVGVDWPQPRRR
jgi:hypothetical protein